MKSTDYWTKFFWSKFIVNVHVNFIDHFLSLNKYLLETLCAWDAELEAESEWQNPQETHRLVEEPDIKTSDSWTICCMCLNTDACSIMLLTTHNITLIFSDSCSIINQLSILARVLVLLLLLLLTCNKNN